MDNQTAKCRCAQDLTEAEARFHCAKQALLHAQDHHCAAADELLLARAEVERMLEAVFPEPERNEDPL